MPISGAALADGDMGQSGSFALPVGSHFRCPGHRRFLRNPDLLVRDMKIRTGKIARLPFVVRNELNRRIENGEPGTKLVVWLNAQPQIQGVLREQFGGREITEQNLSDWIAGGYQDWVSLKRLEDEAHQLAEDAGTLAHTARSLPANLATVLSIRYASLMMSWDGEVTEEFERKLRGMERLRQSVSALQRGFHKNWEVDMESRRYWDGVIKMVREQRAKRAENEGIKEMMRTWQKEWNKEHPDQQRHYSFLEPDRRKGKGQQPTFDIDHPVELEGEYDLRTLNVEPLKRERKRRKAKGAKKRKGDECRVAGDGKGRERMKGEGRRMKRGNIQHSTSNIKQPEAKGDECRVASDGMGKGRARKSKKVEEVKSLRVEEAGNEEPRTLNVEPHKEVDESENLGVKEVQDSMREPVGKGNEGAEMQNTERSGTGSGLGAEAKREREDAKQHLGEEIKPEESAEEENAARALDYEARVIEEKKKVRVDAIVWPHRVSRHHRHWKG